MAHTRTRAHALHIAGTYDRAVAHAVTMFQGALENKGKDFHVLMRVHAEACSRLHGVFIDDAKAAKSHVCGIIVVGERE